MYTKKILSAAAAVAVMSTGAIAFEAATGVISNSKGYRQGAVVTENGKQLIKSSYENAIIASNEISLSTTQKGDALVYPLFSQNSDWGTTIVVRNTSKNAIVAKAVLYAGSDSREVIDFNIYLSAKDVCRFTIKDGKIKSNDGSIRTLGIYPHDVKTINTVGEAHQSSDLTDYALVKFANEVPLDFAITNPEESGYVVIYGMEQSTGVSAIDGKAIAASKQNGFHNDHAGLYAGYAATLDENRTGWRNIVNPTSGDMTNGMFVKSVTNAPNLDASADVSWEKWITSTTGNKIVDRTATFTDVDDVLTGHVTISTNGRDTLLPATAISGFTNDSRVVWTEGEYAAIADRCLTTGTIRGTGTSSEEGVLYNAACVRADAEVLRVNSAVYTFANEGKAGNGQLIFTQPYKRILAQLGTTVIRDGAFSYGGVRNWTRYNATTKAVDKVDTGMSYFFLANSVVYDEDEKTVTPSVGATIITSPVTTTATNDPLAREVQAIGSDKIEKSAGYANAFDDKNGFADISVAAGTAGLPAIVTQMTASKTGTSTEINWVYSDTTRP